MTVTALRSLRGGKLLIVAVALAGGLLLVGRLVSDLYVEVLWYRSVGYTPVFVRRIAWLWGVRLAWAAVVVVSLVVSLRLVSRTLTGIQIKRRFGNLEISERLPRTYVWWGILAVSVLLGAWFGSAVHEGVAWTLLLAIQSADWGLVEPVMGRDVSFYVFTLPLLRTGTSYLMVLTFLVFTLTAAGYAATGAVRWGRGGVVMANQPRIHLGALVAFFFVLLALRFWISGSVLLLYGNSAVERIFGYADAEARLPALRVMILVALASAAAILWGVWSNRLVPVVSGLASVVLGSLLALQFYPSLVQRFRVEPNELERETRYIEHNLEFTRRGFALADLERRSFQYRPSESTDWEGARSQFEGLPVWPAQVLLTAFHSIDARFAYYEFPTVDFTRYPAGEDGDLMPVAIAVREIDVQGIPEANWQNLHLRERFIAGMGAVAAGAAGSTLEGRPPMLLSGIPPEFTGGPRAPQGLRLSRPAVFFGSRVQRYAIINANVVGSVRAGGVAGVETPGASGAEAITGVPGVDFPEGIPLNAVARKLALAWRFKDANLLFSSEVTDSSRMVFRRGVRERAEEIAPFFRYLETPYPVIADGRVVWILEGFTATRQFPLASARLIGARQPASYLRNSVKVTVDAVTGDTRFYAVPEADPLRDAYARAFPGLLRPLDEMPEEIRAHLRYSKTLLATQGEVLLQYHQETARLFHAQQDVWDVPYELFQSTNPVPYRPEYGIYRLPGEVRPTFNLTTAFVPLGRPNLAAVLVGRMDEERRPELILFDLPVEDQAPGPRQIDALVEQDPVISQQFSLWRSGGSQVWTGHLHVVPVGSQLFYMEPVFLAATDQAIPELRRFVVSDGRRVAMEPTLDAAIAVLAGDRVAVRDPTVDERDFPDAPAAALWPREALELLDLANERLRVGDWSGFGAALEQLRIMLERLARDPGE